MTSEEALKRLKEGNARFASGRARFPTVQKEVLKELAKGQQPYATILGCSDSRVPPELVFDAGFGELFIVRVAGNVLGPSILGTLQYAGTHLKTPLFVVMGHEGCGAVKAAIATKFSGAAHKSRIALLLENILPALDGLDRTQPTEALLRSAVEANVRHTMRELLGTPEAKLRTAAGGRGAVGADVRVESRPGAVRSRKRQTQGRRLFWMPETLRRTNSRRPRCKRGPRFSAVADCFPRKRGPGFSIPALPIYPVLSLNPRPPIVGIAFLSSA